MEKCFHEAKLKINLSNSNEMISHSDLNRLINVVSDLAEDNFIGLKSGVTAEFSSLGLIGQLLLNCSDLNEVLQTYMKYQVLFCNSLYYEIDRINSELSFIFKPFHLEDVNRNLIDSQFSFILTVCRKLTGKNIKPLIIDLQYPEVDNVSEYKKLYHQIPHFSSKENRLILPLKILDYKVITASPDIKVLLEDEVNKKIKFIGTKKQLSSKIIKSISKSLPVKIPKVKECASELGLSVRSLQKKLSEEGTSFREIVNSFKIDLGDRYLKSGLYSVSEISYLLNFSEESAFIRFYKRIKGVTPGKVT